MPEGAEENGVVICPSCGEVIDTSITLWLLLGKWYCSEKCVRASMKM
jgi:hypothetical protein